VISTLLDYALAILAWSWRIIRRFVRQRPVESALIALAIIRSFGTIVQSGQAGVLFFCGRARKVLDHGFHPLIPIVHYVRKVPIRSITLDLPRQRVANTDGLVFDVDTSIVYRIDDPVKAVTLVDNLTTAITNVVPLVVHEIIREQARDRLTDRQALDAELTERCAKRLAAWGLSVEQAGMSSISPTRRTIRLSQLRQRVVERRKVLGQVEQAGAGWAIAVALATAAPPPLGHAAARYRRNRRLRLLQRRQLPAEAPPQQSAPGEGVWTGGAGRHPGGSEVRPAGGREVTR
jgi:hypothetical protein